MTEYDAPNQQVVRADGSGPGDTGAAADTETVDAAVSNGETKAELLARAQELGVSPANAGMTKEELQAGIDAKLAEVPV